MGEKLGDNEKELLADEASDQQKGVPKCPDGSNHSYNASHK